MKLHTFETAWRPGDTVWCVVGGMFPGTEKERRFEKPIIHEDVVDALLVEEREVWVCLRYWPIRLRIDSGGTPEGVQHTLKGAQAEVKRRMAEKKEAKK